MCREAYGRTVRVSRELFTVIEFAQRVSVLSGGKFDITIGARTRGRKGTFTGTVGYQYVALGAGAVRLARPDMQLDLGALAKGFIADEVSRSLDARGVRRHLVALSGDIVLGDAPPGEEGWKIGVGPRAELRRLARRGVATAGNASQPGHIWDAAAGRPVEGKEVLTVVASDGLTADALDTALWLLEPGERAGLLAAFPGVEVVG
ncbi:MAG: FAD:protein FMN transferase [Bryobacter sp.]|nr:FAD:protein FMN transferase [Bryobacter sp.]